MDLYYDIKEPRSYGGVDALYRLVNNKGQKTTRKHVINWLPQQEAYSLHKPIRRRFNRRKIFVKDTDYLWQADLVDMTHIADYNHRYQRRNR